MKTTLLSILFTMIFCTSLSAEELVDGKIYSGPIKIELSEYGFEFELPRGWVGKLMGEEFLAQKGEQSAVISLGLSKLTKKKALEMMKNKRMLDAGVILSPTGKVKVKGNRLFVPAKMSLPEGELKSEVRVLIGKYGFSATLMGFGKSEPEFKVMQKALNDVEKTIQFAKPKVAKSSGYWSRYLQNKRLLKYNTKMSGGDGSSSKLSYSFCPKGRVHFYSSDSFHSTTGSTSLSGASQGGEEGRWTAVGSKKAGKITLRWKDGSGSEATLGFGAKGELLVNGERWLREDISCN